MNSEERRMIADLFERMRSFGPVEKEDEAERMIREEVRRMPDAPYMLVQSVLVQEMALRRADERIRDLEERLGELEAGRGRAAQGGGSFLGGLFGGGSRSSDSDPRERPARASSVPSVGRAPMGAPARDGEDWRSGSGPQMRRGGGGSFLQSAMATAAGVAGGVLLADSIRGLFGDEKAGTAAAGEPAKEAATQETSQQAEQQEPQHQDPANNDPGVEDAGYDGGDWGGDGGSFDI